MVLFVVVFSVMLVGLVWCSLIPLWWIPLYLVMSVLTFIAYGIDKYKAKKGSLRVPESTLHIYSLLGGWMGAVCGQRVFKHKTLKQPFRKWFFISIGLNLACFMSMIALPYITG